MSRRLLPNKYGKQASLNEKLDVFFLNIRKGQKLRYVARMEQMRYLSLFWEVMTGITAAWLDKPEDGYLRQFLIVSTMAGLSYLSHYIWASYLPHEPLAVALRDFTQDRKNFYTHLTRKEAKETISDLNSFLTREQLVYMVNREARKKLFQQMCSIGIIFVLGNFFNPDYSFLLIKCFFVSYCHQLLGFYAVDDKLTKETSLITQQQEATSELLKTVFNELFENLDIKSEQYIPVDKDKTAAEQSYQMHFRNLFKIRSEEEKYYARNKLISIFFYIEETLLLTFSFVKETKMVNQPDIYYWDPLIHLLAKRFNHYFSNIILETSPNTLKIAILPKTVKNPSKQELVLPEVQAALEVGATKMQQAYAHCRELNKVSSMLSLSPWQIDFSVDENHFLKVTLLNNHTHTLDEEIRNEFIAGLTEEKYQVYHAGDSLSLGFHTDSTALSKLEKRLMAFHKKNLESKSNMTGENKKMISHASFLTYFPKHKENKTCSFFNTLWGFSARARRYASKCFWEQNVTSPIGKPATIWKFGEYGDYVEIPLGDEKITSSSSIKQSAILRLKGLNGGWTNEFIVVTTEAVAKIERESEEVQKNILEYIGRAQIVPHIGEDKLHKKSGFVLPKEATKKGRSPVVIKLVTSQTELRLHTDTGFTYKQGNGVDATLYVLNKFEKLHRRTAFLSAKQQVKLQSRAASTPGFHT